MQRLLCVKLPEVRSIVRDQGEIVLARMAQDVPVFPPSLADVRNVTRFVACFGRNSHELNAETLINQKPHEG